MRSFSGYIQVILPYFILWHAWKAQNESKLDLVLFIIDVVVNRVVSDLKLACSIFYFEPSQLRGVLGSQFTNALILIELSRKTIHLVEIVI